MTDREPADEGVLLGVGELEPTIGASPGGAGHGPDGMRPAPRSDLRGVLHAIAAVAAPVTIVAALMLHIGTVRQATLSRYFGLQVSVLGYTPQDLMQRSTDALVPFLIGVCVLLLVVVAAWALAAAMLQRYPQVEPVLAWGAIVLGTIGVAVGVWRLVLPVKLTGSYYLVGPLGLGLGIVLVAAGARLAVEHGFVPLRQLPAILWTTAAAATTVLILLALFWAANDYARVQGRARAEEFASSLGARPGVIVHSERQLQVSSPGVQEKMLTTADGEHTYRYDGLRLWVRSGGRYFLIPTSWSRGGTDVVIVLPEDRQVQLEFAPGGRP
jgi:hypothetical protein